MGRIAHLSIEIFFLIRYIIIYLRRTLSPSCDPRCNGLNLSYSSLHENTCIKIHSHLFLSFDCLRWFFLKNLNNVLASLTRKIIWVTQLAGIGMACCCSLLGGGFGLFVCCFYLRGTSIKGFITYFNL